MAPKRTRVSRRMLFVWCLLGGFICLFAPPSMTDKLQLAYASVFSWPLQAGRRLARATAVPPLATVDSANTSAGPSQTDRDRLMNHIANLEARLRQAQTDISALTHLRQTRPQWERMSFLPADVITMADPSLGTLVISCGKQDGVAEGQFVLGDLSIIGVVSSVSRQTAQVTLVTNPASRISVAIGDSDVSRVMEATRIPLVWTTTPIRQGDIVYAKKKPGVLDVPIIVGRIAQCKADPKKPELWDLTVEPACKIDALASVFVIGFAPQK